MDPHGISADSSRRGEQRRIMLRWEHARVRWIRNTAIVAETGGSHRA